MKKPGYFDDDKREYTVTDMYPRRPWFNHLWNDFQAAPVDQFGFGVGWNYEGAVRTNLVRGTDSRLIFVKEEQTGRSWAANRNYLREPFDEFYTVVGQGYSRVVSRYRGVRATFLLFIPEKGNCECWQAEVENTAKQSKDLSLYAYANANMNICGHLAFLQEEIPYYKSEKTGTVLDHCRRGINFLFTELGSHGLCLWGGGDWNDSLNSAGLQLKGESVWLSEAAVASGKEFAGLLEIIGERNEADVLRVKIQALTENLLKHAYEQGHFLCGFNDWGEKVGSYENKEARIFLNMQTWAVLAGILDEKAANELMDLVEKELSCPFGYVLCKPSYSKGDDHIGRVSYMEKGAYENGSVYNHGVAFKIAADCRLGRGDIANKTVRKMLSNNPKNDCLKSGVEPYAVSNMYLGPENKLRSGEAVMGWITGTAGWLFRDIVENIAGVRAGYRGLELSPCLPSAWKEVSARREYRNATYNIRILNPSGLQTGKLTVFLDGKPLRSNVLPDLHDNREHEVLAEMSHRDRESPRGPPPPAPLILRIA